MPKATYFIIGFIIFVIGVSIGFFGKDFYDKEKKIGKENNQSMPVSTAPMSSCLSINWANLPFDGENYFQKFSLRGKITSVNQSEIQINISNIDVAEMLNSNPNDSGERKITITNETKIVAEPKNTMGDPAPINGADIAIKIDNNAYKDITVKNLAKDDIIFIMTVEDIQTANELTAIKIVKEQSDLMEAAPLPES